MSLTRTFKGTVKDTIVNNKLIKTDPDNLRGKPPVLNLEYGYIAPMNLYNDQEIQWDKDNPVPPSLIGAKINDIINTPFSTTIIDITFTISQGFQQSEAGSTPVMEVGLFTFNEAPPRMISLFDQFSMPTVNPIPVGSPINVNYCSPEGKCPTYTITNLGPNIITVELIAWNQCPNAVPECSNKQTGPNTSFIYTAEVSFTILCNSTDFESGICLEYCTTPSNLGACLDTYTQLCLVDTDSTGDARIFGSTGCQTYFNEYTDPVNKPEYSLITSQLTAACKKKISISNESENGFFNQSKSTQDICACYLDPTFYDNLQKQLEGKFPETKLINEPAICLFPPCVNTGRPPISCPPICLTITDINNNGTIGGNIRVIGKTECINATKTGSANEPPNGGPKQPGGTEEPWYDKYWMWIAVGIGFLIVLIIAIIIIIIAEESKKKSEPKLDIG